MTAKDSNKSATPQKKLPVRSALGSALGVAVLGTSFFMSVGVNKSHAEIIDSGTENISQMGRDFAGAKGGATCNHLQNVTTFMGNEAHPVRAGRYAFQHWVDRCGERSELLGKTTAIGETYWYGWSVFIPSDWKDSDAGYDIINQFGAYPSKQGRRYLCGGIGSMISREGKTLNFIFQRKEDSVDVECTRYPLVKVSEARGQWIDFVVHVKWTGNTDGFLQLWTKTGGNPYTQKLDLKGRTFWNDEGKGPYLKMGLYKGDPNFNGPAPRYLYTDEYRLGDANSSFEQVAP